MPARRSKPSIGRCRQVDSAGEDDRPRAQDVTGVEVQLAIRGVDPGDRPGDEDLGAQPPRLPQRAARQLVAGDARGEAEVVLDPGGGAGLAAGRLALDHDRAQALRRPVHGRGQPGRAGADDHRVVLGGARLGVDPEQLGHPAQLGPDDGLAVDDPDRRPVLLGGQGAAPLLGRVGSLGREPLEGDLVAVEEAAQLGAGRVPAVPDHDRARRRRVGRDGLQARASRRSGGPRACRSPCRRPAPRPRPRGSRGPRFASRATSPPRDREHRPEHNRTSPKILRVTLADHVLDPVDGLDRLDPARERGEDRPLVALVRCVLARHQAQVRHHTRKPLALGGGEFAKTPTSPISSALTI